MNAEEALIKYVTRHLQTGHSIYSAMLGLYHDNEQVHFSDETGAFTHLSGRQLKHVMKLDTNAFNCLILRGMQAARPQTGRQPVPVTVVKDGQRRVFPSVRSAARALRVPASNISRVLNGKARTVRGWQVFNGVDEQ